MKVQAYMFYGCAVFFLAADIVYWLWSGDWTGTTALALSVGLAGLVAFYLHFTILNNGKRMHNFEIFGRKTQVLKPAGRAHFNVFANSRGSFPYESTLDKDSAFRGHLAVF